MQRIIARLSFTALIMLLAAAGCAPAPTAALPSASPPPAESPVTTCLPPNIKPTEIVSVEMSNGVITRQVTVEQKLKELQTHCSPAGKLLAQDGREIYFYRLTGCWGRAPTNAQEILQKQADALTALRQTYAVVEMTCDPAAVMKP